MKAQNLSLLTSLFIVVFIVGMGFGYFISPSYQQTMFEKQDMGLGQADRFVDKRYIDKMISHHRGAMLLASQVLSQSDRQEIRNLAQEILNNEPKLIAELYAWKKSWYKDNRKVSDPIVPNLGQKDTKLDLRFLNALITHHQDGIEMTREIRSKSSRNEILNNADAVETFLKNSLSVLNQWRETWYQDL